MLTGNILWPHENCATLFAKTGKYRNIFYARVWVMSMRSNYVYRSLPALHSTHNKHGKQYLRLFSTTRREMANFSIF